MDTSNKNEKAEIIATIDVNLKWVDESVYDHLHCVLCGTSLSFNHKTNFVEQIVVEEAHCAGCGVRNRKSEHRLQ